MIDFKSGKRVKTGQYESPIVVMRVPKRVKHCATCKRGLVRISIQIFLMTFDWCDHCQRHYDTV